MFATTLLNEPTLAHTTWVTNKLDEVLRAHEI